MNIKLKNYVLVILIAAAQPVCAATIDFSDGVFEMVLEATSGGNPLGVPEIFSETVDGTTFTFRSTVNLNPPSRFLDITLGNPSNGLRLGGFDNSTIEFTMLTSRAISLDSYSTDTGGFFVTPLTVDISGAGVNSAGNSLDFGEDANIFAGAPLLLTPGAVYTFSVQGSGPVSQAYMKSFEFTTLVPLPPAFALFGAALFTLIARPRVR